MTEPSNWRATRHLAGWMKSNGLVGLAGVDTRELTRHIRDGGAPKGALIHAPEDEIDTEALRFMATSWPGLEGMDLAQEVSCRQPYNWNETEWTLSHGFGRLQDPRFHVVALDFGAKRNILRCLAAAGCRVTVLPASATIDDIVAYDPDGVFLSNGPGDPAATGVYAVPTIRAVLEKKIPMFGICLGHQMLGLALGAKTFKMHLGHRGANHPVKDLETGKVEITSQNHGFVVDRDTLPANAARNPLVAVRRLAGRFEGHRRAGLLGPVSPRSLPGPAGRPLPVPAVHGDDGSGPARLEIAGLRTKPLVSRQER